MTSIRENIQDISKTSTTKNKALNKRKPLQKHAKKRARSYDHENARNTRNGATIEKTQLLNNLYYNRKEKIS